MAYDKADFVHMSGTHNLFVAALTFDYSNNITNVINRNGIGQRGHRFDNQIANTVLKTGCPGRLTKFFEEFDVHDKEKNTLCAPCLQV